MEKKMQNRMSVETIEVASALISVINLVARPLGFNLGRQLFFNICGVFLVKHWETIQNDEKNGELRRGDGDQMFLEHLEKTLSHIEELSKGQTKIRVSMETDKRPQQQEDNAT